jgi:splicing factor 3B subunit 3
MCRCVLPLDHDTVAGGDKFGNVFVLRVPSDVSDDVDNPTGNRLLWDAALLNGAPTKAIQVIISPQHQEPML